MRRILLVGCGRLGSAFVRGWTAGGQFEVLVLDPGARAVEGAEVLSSVDQAVASAPEVVVLAVKPHVMPGLLEGLRPLTAHGPLFVSLAAGVTLSALQQGLGLKARIARAMPNTPAAVGRAITAVVAGPALPASHRAACGEVLSAVGEVIWLTSEDWLDAVTAISGCGPAYFFRFTEAMARAGEQLGLPPPVALQLARATLGGSGALVTESDDSLEALRQAVTSPGGATASGLAVFDRYSGLDRLVATAAGEAAARSRQLGCAAPR